MEAKDNIQDEDLGGRKNDSARLRLGWAMYNSLRLTADKRQAVADALRLAVLALTLATVVAATFASQGGNPALLAMLGGSNSTWQQRSSSWLLLPGVRDDATLFEATATVLAVFLPLVATALLTAISRFDAEGQALELKSGAAILESEIYKFRTVRGAAL